MLRAFGGRLSAKALSSVGRLFVGRAGALAGRPNGLGLFR